MMSDLLMVFINPSYPKEKHLGKLMQFNGDFGDNPVLIFRKSTLCSNRWGLSASCVQNNGPSSHKGAPEFHFFSAQPVIVLLCEHELHYRFGHVRSMYRSSPLRSTVNTSYITGLDMCKVCTKAVHSVALWTRVTLQVWTCAKYVPKQSIA